QDAYSDLKCHVRMGIRTQADIRGSLRIICRSPRIQKICSGSRHDQNLGSQFEKMRMNASTDHQLLSEKIDKKQLFTSESTVTWDAVKSMNREVNGRAAARSCFVIMAVLVLISETAFITANSIVGYMLMALAVLIAILDMYAY
ncbi:MAG: hypothetical protein ACI4WR_00025, partial [Bulleidia sp.]